MKSRFFIHSKKTFRSSLVSAVLILLIIFTAFAFRKDGRKPFKSYVIMVSLDAFRWDYHTLYNTPNINKIAEAGVKADRLIPSFPTVTFPNHYSIATGLYPDHHGIINNSFLAPDLGLFYRIGDRVAVENAAFYWGEPIWSTAEKQGARAASFFWVGSEALSGGKQPTYWKKYDESVTYEARIDTVIKWMNYPESRRPELITLYFDEPDATSHKFGPNSPQTKKVVERLDSLVGVLRTKVAALPYSKRVNFILLSDHGMGAISPDKYVNIKELVPDRMIKSIAGGNPFYLVNPTDGKADSILLLLNAHKGIKAWNKEQVPARLHYGTNPRIPQIVVSADSLWSIGTRPDASSIRGGAHGYDNADTDMHAIFYAVGPAFKKNFRIHELNNVDLYGMICRILDLKPSKNDGNPADYEMILR